MYFLSLYGVDGTALKGARATIYQAHPWASPILRDVNRLPVGQQ
jgi:hypothetical protein